MSERDGYPPGVPCWVATMQPDPAAAADFYGELFGWQIEDAGEYFVGRLRGRDVAAVAPLPPGVEPAPPPAWLTHVCVDDAAEAGSKAEAAGGRAVTGPMDFPDGRINVIADPAGATIIALEPRTHKGAQVVNEPSAWAMSSLSTPDGEAAKAFYGELFGWTTEAFDMSGGQEFTMFRRPGYFGGEPEQPVSREVVATMAPASADAPPSWMPDFWVRDVDAAAARASELGGRVVMEPMEIQVGRTAVLADPAGAVFSISAIAALAD